MRHRLAWAPKDQELRLVRVHEKSFVIKVELQSAKVILKLSQHDREVRSNDEKGDVIGIELRNTVPNNLWNLADVDAKEEGAKDGPLRNSPGAGHSPTTLPIDHDLLSHH